MPLFYEWCCALPGQTCNEKLSSCESPLNPVNKRLLSLNISFVNNGDKKPS